MSQSPSDLSIAQALALAPALGVDRLDAQLLLLHAQGVAPDAAHTRRAWLLAHDDHVLAPQVQAQFKDLLRRRAAGEPFAYLVGHKQFFGLDLEVDARVLIPRPDTETLVQWALECLGPGRSALDLGTGSGAIALALKHALPDLQVDAVDVSLDALAVARANGTRLGLTVGWLQGSWLSGVTRRYDCVVSNPPYIAEGDTHLPTLVSEPHTALVAGPQGLDDLRVIVAGAPDHLEAGGWLLLEHGHDQEPSVRELLTQRGFSQVQTRRDLGGNERCTGGRWAGGGRGCQACGHWMGLSRNPG